MGLFDLYDTEPEMGSMDILSSRNGRDFCAKPASYVPLDPLLFPPIVELYRADQQNRVSQGILTARTILGTPTNEQPDLKTNYGFSDQDVTLHMMSTHSKRLSQPTVGAQGTGSPFVSASPNRAFVDKYYLTGKDASDGGQRMVKIRTLRDRVIVPLIASPANNDPEDCAWQLNSSEFLIVGDVRPEDMEVIQAAPLPRNLFRI